MKNEALVALAGSQRNRVARGQLLATGFTRKAIQHKLARGLLVQVHEGVYAVPPVLDDELALWTGVTLTAPETYLNRLSAACAFGVLEHRPSFETVARPGVGGPRRLDGILVPKSPSWEITSGGSKGDAARPGSRAQSPAAAGYRSSAQGAAPRSGRWSSCATPVAPCRCSAPRSQGLRPIWSGGASA